ncbi:hypothetical protein FB45DRAFT_875152 [Roridomyces roridus]|uniref:Uncharacterized protein n=1 Tax=Roridomyces roridus TaxID=1738132 RepID=A0AAD7B6T2_9AGAR|nr:hypothetical protein FB45DRAFT_875152 [Roridomyces roridus]
MGVRGDEGAALEAERVTKGVGTLGVERDSLQKGLEWPHGEANGNGRGSKSRTQILDKRRSRWQHGKDGRIDSKVETHDRETLRKSDGRINKRLACCGDLEVYTVVHLKQDQSLWTMKWRHICP